MAGTIYLVTNNLNGKQYVGQTIVAGNKVGHGKLMTKAYSKHGKENFTYESICSDIDNKAFLNFAERFWIKVVGSRTPDGYNIEHGGSDKDKVSDETREKLRIANTGQKHTPKHIAKVVKALKNRSPEVWKKVSEKLKGRPVSEETRLKISVGNKGKVLSEETKAKIREARSKQVITEEHKRKLSEAAKKQWARQKGELSSLEQ